MSDVETKTQLVKERDMLRFTTAGSVDDGKSTLIGRMLYDSKQIFQDQMETLEKASRLRGEEQVNLALLTDGLRAEREQGITIDVAYRYFSTARRKYIIADTPGHEQYTRNMVTGASSADLAVILIDARHGVLTQSKRHGIIASLLGIPHVVVCVNKMDLVDYSQERYQEVVDTYQQFARKLNIHDLTFIPVSALVGDNVVNRSEKTPWYEGPPLLQFLENVTISADRNLVDFRFPVQYVVRPHQDFRGFSGLVVSGTIKRGEEITVLPSFQHSKVKGLQFYEQELDQIEEGQSVIITLEDEIDISRGDMIVRRQNVPDVENDFEAVLCWMDERHELTPETQYVLQHTTQNTSAYVDEIVYRLDVNSLHRAPAESLALNEIGRVKITTAKPLFFDSYDRNRATGGFILIDAHDFRTVAAGMIRHSSRGTIEPMNRRQWGTQLAPATEADIQWNPGLVALTDRIAHQGHKPLCVWITSAHMDKVQPLVQRVEKQLFDEGLNVFRLDKANLKNGLNADLRHSLMHGPEPVRRAGHVARLLCDSGQIVLCTLPADARRERTYVRSLFPEGQFFEIFATDEEPLPDKTPEGIKQTFERPEKADLVLDAEDGDADVVLLDFLRTHLCSARA